MGKASLTFTMYDSNVPPKPKSKCCSDKPACKRCPIQMMKKGTLPEGYTVKKRKLVKVKKKDRDKIAA